MKTAGLVILLLAFIITGGLAYILWIDVDALSAQNYELTTKSSALNDDLNAVSAKTAEIEKLRQELLAQNQDLLQKNEALRSELTKATTELQTIRQSFDTLRQENIDLRRKLDGTLPGLKAGGVPIKITNNFSGTHDPTRNELIDFLMADDTEMIPYVEDKFTCGNFAELLHDRAEAKGIRAGVVFVFLKIRRLAMP